LGAALLGLPEPAESARLDLEARVNAHVRALRARGVVKPDEVTAWSVYDFREHRKLVSINEDRPLQAASMIKPFVALAFFYQVGGKGSRLRYTGTVRRRMEAMIRNSSNRATNRLMNILGGPRRVERILKAHAPGIFRQTRIVERIPANGRCYRNLASAHDYSRFLFALWNERLPSSKELKRLLSLPNRDRIYDGVRAIPHGTAVYDKTGTTARLCGNMGILVPKGRDGREYPYTFIAIIQKDRRTRNYSRWVASRGDVIRSVSELVYTWLRDANGLA
jgi:beta-lactamase class A